MDKLAKRLKRELVRSPAKAGLLGLLCVVAVYYYVPIVLRIVSGSGKSASHAAPSPESMPVPIAGPGSSPTGNPELAKATNSWNWREIAERIRQEPLMQPANQLVGARNPFATPPSARDAVEPEEPEKVTDESMEAKVPEPINIEPKEAGLVLWSTMVGASQRVAMINGRTYRENSRITLRLSAERADASASPTEVVYRVARIQPTYVELESNGIRHRLDLVRNRIGAN